MDRCYCTEVSLGNRPRYNGFGVQVNKRSNRNVLSKQAGIKITLLEWAEILKLYKNKCAYCGTSFTPNNMPVKDHVIPISKGGTNSKDNIAPACNDCNMKKRDKFHRADGSLWARDNKLINERFYECY